MQSYWVNKYLDVVSNRIIGSSGHLNPVAQVAQTEPTAAPAWASRGVASWSSAPYLLGVARAPAFYTGVGYWVGSTGASNYGAGAQWRLQLDVDL